MKQTAGNIAAWLIMSLIIVTFPKTMFSIMGVIASIVIILRIQNTLKENRIKKFMKQDNNNYFLFYSSNKKIKPVIEAGLKPLFNFDYDIIFNNRNVMKTNLTKEQLAYLQDVSYMHKLPIVYRIKNNTIHFVSLFSEVNEFKEHRISKEIFEKRVNDKLKKLN